MDTLTVAHLSDPHLTSPAGVPVRELVGKRALGYLSWRLRRRGRHRGEVLGALVQDLRAERPDHVVLTGDLTHLGLPTELLEARRWLERLGPPEHLTVVPGNHDAYASGSERAMVAGWRPYLVSDGAPGDGDDRRDPFPSVRVRGTVAFIGLSSARPTAPFLATGTLGAWQLDRLARMLAECGQRGLCRVVLLHHPAVPGTVHWRKRLTDAAALRAVLQRHGAELVLHGHTHRTTFGIVPGARGPIPVVGVPSASALDTDPARGARYHVYRVRREAGAWRIGFAVRGYSAPAGRFVPEGPPRELLAPDQ